MTSVLKQISSYLLDKYHIGMISKPPVYDNAYVFLLMRGDSYLPGLLAAVYSIHRTNPSADLVVMVTPDISEKTIDIILTVATHIFHVNYLSFNTVIPKSKKQTSHYSSWIDVSYTKWISLTLPYRRIIFFDADIIVLQNVDTLFNLRAPAGCFNCAYVKPLGHIRDFLRGPRGPDGYLLHDQPVMPIVINQLLNNYCMVCCASTILLEPNLLHYYEFCRTMEQLTKNRPFGMRCASGADEQSICYFYSNILHMPFTNIHHRYNHMSRKDGYFAPNDYAIVMHYNSINKPWKLSYDAWPDVICWYKMIGSYLHDVKLNPVAIGIKASDVDKAKKATDIYTISFMKNINKSITSCMQLAYLRA